MWRMRIATVAALAALLPASALAGPCVQWRAPERIGSLDPALVPEASGIVASRAYPGRYYLNNDSGDGPFFYLTGAQDGGTQRIAVSGFAPRDVEDIALGPCAAAQSCVWLGDIGDNAKARASVTFVAVAESEAFAAEVAPVRTIEARYPDGAHDAESFAFHPGGDLYLVTKDYDFPTRSNAPGRVYRLAAAELATAQAGDVLTFAPVGEIDLPALIANSFINQVATAMDISADGTRTLLLTYRTLFEWNEDLADGIAPGRELEPGRDYVLTPIAPLVQAEAVAYLAGEDGVIYTSEIAGPASEAPLFRQLCARRER